VAGDAVVGTDLHQLWNFSAAAILRLPAASIKYTACWWIYWAWKISLQDDALTCTANLWIWNWHSR
jgi:hypothetical protein